VTDRYVVLGLAHARSTWFREVARWATSASLPIEFVPCVSVEELRAALGSGRAFSAVVADAGMPGVDRDLADAARLAGAAVLLVDDGRVRRDWATLGASTVLPVELTRAELLDALAGYATPIGRVEATGTPSAAPATVWRGALVAVTGAPGSGASVVAMAVAQALGADPRHAGLVLLADLALDADQAVLHDAGDVVPGLLELVDAHRMGVPAVDEVRSLTFEVPARGYSLLLGLRRHRDWSAVRPRTLASALDGLRRAYRVVVADVEPDVEGEDQCGSADVEDRNLLARAATTQAGAVVVVGLPGVKGVHSLVRVLGGLLEHGVLPDRVVPVVNRAPRSPRARAEITRAVGELAGGLRHGDRLPSPVFVPESRRLDDLLLDGHRLPAALPTAVGPAIAAVLDRAPLLDLAPTDEPVAVRPGSLGSWTDPEEF
jgi:hypothetical protein